MVLIVCGIKMIICDDEKQQLLCFVFLSRKEKLTIKKQSY